ncbi:hypothetical protein ALC62_00763, partial [Cyphomyrmex costatus]
YAVLELFTYDKFEYNVYAVPACTAWLEDIKVCEKNGKQVTFAAICKWPPNESKLIKSVRQAKTETEKALNVSDLSQSDKDKSAKRQRSVIQRYSPLNEACNRHRRNIINSDDSDIESELKAPAAQNLKISANNKNDNTLLSKSADNDDSENFSDNCTTQSGFNERTIMAAISDLRNRIDKLHVTIIKIYTATCHPEEILENPILGIPTLPLTSMEEFNKWEECNLNEEKKLIMIRLFVKHCKEDLKGSVYCIMRKLMTNKLAVHFNFKGTNRKGVKIQKSKFLDTTFYGLVIAALKRHSQESKTRNLYFLYNRENANSHIANWLKNAKKRLENENIRLQKSNPGSKYTSF